jgi:hypothetical protein
MQLSRLDSEPLAVLYAVAARLYHPSRGQPCAFFVFSDVMDEDGAPSRALVNQINTLGFGSVMYTPPAENPRTGNGVIVYVWTIHHENLKRWYAEKRVEKMKTVGT